jgi:mxaJ protein
LRIVRGRAEKLRLRSLAPAVALVLFSAGLAAAKDFRVCADPDYLPFSNRAEKGFENQIARVTAKALGEPLVYAWASTRGPGGYGEFLSANLDAGKCDALMDLPSGNQEELTTDPYYASSYVFVSRKSSGYDLENMDAPILQKVRIGFERDTPPEDALKLRDLIPHANAFAVGETEGVSPASMLQALHAGRIDVLITWEPAIGLYLRDYPDLRVSRVPNSRANGAPEQYLFSMSMAVRKRDADLKQRLDRVIADHKGALAAILQRYNVQLYPTAGETL